MSHKVVCWQVGLSVVPLVFLGKPYQCFTWWGFLLSLCVCPCSKYLKNYWTDELHFWWRPSLWQGGNHSILKKITMGQGGWGFQNLALMIRWEKKFQVAITPKWWGIHMWLLLDTNSKPYMGSPRAPFDLNLSDLERSNSRSPRFWKLISHKGTQLSPMLLLNINRKPHTGSPMALSHLTLIDLERSNKRSPRYWSLISRKRAYLGAICYY